MFFFAGNESKLLLCGSAGDGKLAGMSKMDILEPKELEFFTKNQISLLACGCDHVIVCSGMKRDEGRGERGEG